MKLAIISYLVPPMPSGQSMMLYRLLQNVRPDDYCLFTTQTEFEPDQDSSSFRLRGKYFHISTSGELARGYRLGLLVAREWYNVTVGAFMRARQIARIIRQE